MPTPPSPLPLSLSSLLLSTILFPFPVLSCSPSSCHIHNYHPVPSQSSKRTSHSSDATLDIASTPHPPVPLLVLLPSLFSLRLLVSLSLLLPNTTCPKSTNPPSLPGYRVSSTRLYPDSQPCATLLLFFSNSFSLNLTSSTPLTRKPHCLVHIHASPFYALHDQHFLSELQRNLCSVSPHFNRIRTCCKPQLATPNIAVFFDE
ncbi:hypothetical protein B0T10DRAFT_268895 [Thelonectria olida]|uniref:Uncharacterized protein n=1 Tax=Thelonectria olida TaxID=1576542 RepID=A0A9P8W8P4_9HYPO|nr:hypothetical protein B0T10DRAFT_268895 [Thelonectria olida]